LSTPKAVGAYSFEGEEGRPLGDINPVLGGHPTGGALIFGGALFW